MLPLLALGDARARPAPARARPLAAVGAGRRRGRCPALALLAVALVYLANAARLFAVKPLLENDGWALWGLRAQALYDAGHPFAPVFTDDPYPALQYPLLLPGLEAIDARFMRRFDGTPIHLQLLGLAVAFVGAAWTLLRGHAPSLLLAATLLAMLTAPSFFGQLADEQRRRAARDGDRARRRGARGVAPHRRARASSPPRRSSSRRAR